MHRERRTVSARGHFILHTLFVAPKGGAAPWRGGPRGQPWGQSLVSTCAAGSARQPAGLSAVVCEFVDRSGAPCPFQCGARAALDPYIQNTTLSDVLICCSELRVCTCVTESVTECFLGQFPWFMLLGANRAMDGGSGKGHS